MSKNEIEQKATLSRAEVGEWLAELAAAIDRGGPVEVGLVGPLATIELPERLRCEVEIEQDGDEVELEIELTWAQAAS